MKMSNTSYTNYFKSRGIDMSVKIRIILPQGKIEVPYMWLECQPPHMTNKRKWERWVRKFIKIAAEHGGWTRVQRDRSQSHEILI